MNTQLPVKFLTKLPTKIVMYHQIPLEHCHLEGQVCESTTPLNNHVAFEASCPMTGGLVLCVS